MGNKYKILVYAYDVFGYLISSSSRKANNYIIHYDTFDESKDFNLYDIVILQHGAFFQKNRHGQDLIRRNELIQRGKEVMRLIQAGKTLCFLYHHIPERVPIGRDVWGRPRSHYDLNKCFLSINMLDRYLQVSLEYHENEIPIHKTHRSEFTEFIDKYGVGFNSFVFPPDNSSAFDVISVSPTKNPTAFAYRFSTGATIMFLPCYVARKDEDVTTNLFSVLAEAIVTYLQRTKIEAPKWVGEFVFTDEEPLRREFQVVQKRVKDLNKELSRFDEFKKILYLHDYELEKQVPIFLDSIGILTRRQERFIEDFWILENNREVAICECKGLKKNLTRGRLAQLEHHRGEYSLRDDFPAVMFVNIFLGATSLKQKQRQIERKEITKAVNDHLLIIRTIDLVFAYDQISRGLLTAKRLLTLLKTEVGWLEVTRDRYLVHKS